MKGQAGHTKEGNSLSSIHKTMIVCQCDDHNGTNDDLAVYDDWLVLDCVHT